MKKLSRTQLIERYKNKPIRAAAVIEDDCQLCGRPIRHPDKYYDRGASGRAHVECVDEPFHATLSKVLTDPPKDYSFIDLVRTLNSCGMSVIIRAFKNDCSMVLCASFSDSDDLCGLWENIIYCKDDEDPVKALEASAAKAIASKVISND